MNDALSGMSHKCKNCCNIYLEGHAHISQENSSSQPLSDSPGQVEELAESMPVILLFLLKRKNRFMRKEWAPIQILEWFG